MILSVLFNRHYSIFHFTLFGTQADIICNAVSCLFAISKRSNCKEFLLDGEEEVEFCLMIALPPLLTAKIIQYITVCLISLLHRDFSATLFFLSFSHYFSLLPFSLIFISAPLHANVHLLKLSKSSDSSIRANCARTLKNLSSDSLEVLY